MYIYEKNNKNIKIIFKILKKKKLGCHLIVRYSF